MSLLDQMKLSFAKALQFGDLNMFTELPECAVLSATNEISIKVASLPQMQAFILITVRFELKIKAIIDFIEKSDTNFHIKFLIRDEQRNKKTIMTADLITGQGFEVRSSTAGHVMDIKISNESSASIGEIVHPLRTTLYKVLADSGQANVQRYRVYKLAVEEPLMSVEKERLSIYRLANMLGLLETECAYSFRRLDGTVVGHVRPKIALNGRTLILTFPTSQLDAQLRAAVLGVSLVLVLKEVYPEMRNALATSMVEMHEEAVFGNA